MKLFVVKAFFLVVLGIANGCTSYKIPIETDDHPISTKAEIYQIELSPILNIHNSEENKIYEDLHY